MPLLWASACDSREQGPRFPHADRPVAPLSEGGFSTEEIRDRAGEADQVMALAGVRPGMSVADIGAGEGYYTVRLAREVGAKGRVLAEDIVPAVRDRLAQRVQREGLDRVAVRLGTPTDPRLPARSFDRIFLVQVYHEVAEPYEFLWNLAGGLAPGGEVIVVDWDRPVGRHGFPRDRLRCELAALGLEPVREAMLEGGSYFIAFRQARPRPTPDRISPCRMK